jgi:hypothetical protein
VKGRGFSPAGKQIRVELALQAAEKMNALMLGAAEKGHFLTFSAALPSFFCSAARDFVTAETLLARP